MLLALYFFTVIALPLALGAFVVFNGLPRSRRCPTCAGDTLRLRSWLHALTSRVVRSGELHSRWCISCGWRGTTRIPRTRVLAVSPTAAAAGAPLDMLGAADSVDIRQIDVDGNAWRVLVQCWADNGQWLGRLLFIGPGGRAWAEESSSMEGGSALEILSRALTIPEQTLAGRLRRALR